MRHLLIAALLGLAQSGSPAAADNAAAGEFVIEHPTLNNLGFEWRIDGDANRNARVDVSYRKQGETAWREAMPLARLHGEQTFQRNVFNLVTPNMFAGSILDLESGTAYEARFVLSDPDGVSGPAADATKVVTVRTRPEPMPASGGKTYHVYPTKWKGPKTEPAFEGIMCAYNYYCGAGDTAPGGRPRVKPGDTVLVHGGTYAYHYEFYGNQTTVNATTTFEGTYYLTGKGTAEQPIVIKAAGDGEVVLDGRGNFNLFNVKAADYNYFEGITFRNTQIAIWAGTQFIAGSKGLTVKRCRFEDVGMGVFTNYSGSSDFYIADSVFLGRNDSRHLMGWNGQFWQQFEHVEGQEFPPVMRSYTGIRLYGPGHVVTHNYVADFHDGIDTEMYGMPDGSHAIEGPNYPPREFWDRRPTSIDIIENYITNAHDNSIEMDGSMHNVRVMRNMLINSASHPMSAQPSVGGPIYFIRNIVFHAPGGSTRLTAGAPGIFFYNNTILSETNAAATSNAHWRNNLMLGENAQAAIFSVNTFTNYSSSDYNGFRPNGGNEAFQWNSPPWTVAAILPDGTSAAKSETRKFATLEAYQQATKQDQHSLLVDFDVFMKVPKLDGKDPATVQRLYRAEDFDFRLRSGSAAIDRGVAIPNVTDGFSGRAPDLGALETGQAAPVYGPRPARVTVLASEIVEAGAFIPPNAANPASATPFKTLPAFRRVVLKLTPSADSDIRAEVWLPLSGWNHKLQVSGNGGLGGAIPYPSLAASVRAGYAAAGTDTGHVGGNADFVAGHPEKLVDFGHRAIHETTVAAKAIAASQYESGPARAYFNSCSTGGRQALIEAQLYPEDFDGIVAGDPSWDQMRLYAARVWLNTYVNRTPAAVIPASKYPAIHKAVLEKCDAIDGVNDGVIEDPSTCAFDFAAMTCAGEDRGDCLTKDQVVTAKAMTSPIRDPKSGAVLHPGKYYPGSELGWGGVAGPSPSGESHEGMRKIVFTPDWDYHTINVPADVERAVKADRGLLYGGDPDLSRFFGRGGKLLMYHGWADPLVSPDTSLIMFKRINDAVGRPASNSLALFMVPGMGHCQGGPGTDVFDRAAALDQWVESGVKPQTIVASHMTNGAIDRTRPLCAYPLTARYTGSGSTDDAKNFVCR